MNDCIFCQIVQGRLPAKIRYEDNNFLALDDTNPRAPTHILLIPKKHFESVASLSEGDKILAGEMILRANKIAAEAGLDRNFRLTTNTGPDAGQAVLHLHFHILGGRPLGPVA
ncbi:MAG: histidine triad nucleotide-binding protein [Patescibacteria group bacterium]